MQLWGAANEGNYFSPERTAGCCEIGCNTLYIVKKGFQADTCAIAA